MNERLIRHPGSWAERRFYSWLLDNHSKYRHAAVGGARGGAKSEMFGRGAVLVSLAYPGTITLILRKGTQAVVENYRKVIRAYCRKIGFPVGPNGAVEYFKNDRRFEFYQGSQIILGFIDQEEDYEKYIGNEYGLILLSQAEQHPKQRYVDLISGKRRFDSEFIPKDAVDFNPGGIGQAWLNELFVEPTRPKQNIWIPCRTLDNPAAIIKNPDYIRDDLAQQPDYRKKQWILGDMKAQAGQYFEVLPANVRSTESVFAEHCHGADVPYWGRVYGGADYGDSAPFAVPYSVRWKDRSNNEHIHTFSEIYQANLDLDEQAYRVLEHEEMLKEQWPGLINGRIQYFADPQIFARTPVESRSSSRTIAQVWGNHGFHVSRAKTRNRVAGWKLMKMLLRPRGPEGNQQVIWTIDPSCMALLSEMRAVVPNGWPGVVLDEDIEQGPNIPDHALDGTRYKLVSTFGIGYRPMPCNPLTGVPYKEDRELARV